MIQILLEVGVLFLLLYLPLAAGGVTGVSLMLLAFWCTGLFLLWLATGIDTSQLFLRRGRKQRRSSHVIRRSWRSIQQKQRYAVHVTLVPGTLIFGLFLMLAGIQLMPLPAGLVKLISPFTFQLYADAATQTGNPLPAWIPLSIATQSTETEFYKLIAYGLFFIVLVNILRTISQIRRLVYSLLIIGLVEAFYGFSQISQSRISGSFVNHNHFAGYLGMVIPLTFGLLLAQLESRNQVTRRLLFRIADEKHLKTLLLIGFLLILTSALFLSGSRGGFISLSLAVMGMCGLLFLRRLFRKWIWGIVGLMGLMLGLGVLTQPEAILQRFGALTNPQQDLAFLSRLDVWRDSMRLFADVPVLGTGLGTFAHIFRRYQSFPSAVVFTHAENDYIQLLTETGIIGSGLVLWACIAFGLSAFRAWRQQHSRWAIAMGIGGFSALLGMGIHSGSDFNLHIPSNAMLFTAITALTYAVVHLQSPDSQITGKTEEYAEKRVVSPHERQFIGSSFLIGGVGTGIIVLIGVYCTLVGRSYWASAANSVFRENIAIARNYPAATGLETLTRAEYQAIRLDPNHADYYFTLGSYLWHHDVDHYGVEVSPEREGGLDLAKSFLQQAIQRDPANPWYYYELWRLSVFRDTCTEEWEQCAATHHIRMAFANGPYELLIRTQLAAWSSVYDPDYAYRIIHEVLHVFPEFTHAILEGLWHQIRDIQALRAFLPNKAEVLEKFSRFLYSKRADYASDRMAAEACGLDPVFQESSSKCQNDVGLQTCASPPEFGQSETGNMLEIGYDDGSAEWRTYLAADDVRVKKVLCLPGNIESYTSATVQVLMNAGVPGEFIADISLDDHLLQRYENSIEHTASWYAIPVDMEFLRGKSRVFVYVRVQEASASGNYLQIMGDQDASTSQSVWNFATIDDLSNDEGKQTGEYMIRLILH